MVDCAFCKIVCREAPATIIFESASSLGIVPLEPVAKGHALLIPKEHFENIFDIGKSDLEQLAVDAKSLSRELAAEKHATGINLLHASGKDAQQSVPHFHFHIVPRYPDDDLDLWIKNRL